MVPLLPHPILDILGFLAVLVALATIYVRYTYGYWKRRKVPYLEPTFPFGNGDRVLPKGFSLGIVTRKFYDEFKSKGHTVGGVYIGTKPVLIVLGADRIKEVMIRDFRDFSDRENYVSEKDPLSVHIASLPFEQWKLVRTKFTPLFTAARIKAMFETMLECCEGLKGALENLEAQQNDVDAQEMAACFATDVIGSFAFGIDCNSFQTPDAEFRTAGRKFFKEFSFMDELNLFLTVFTPNLAKILGARFVQKDVSLFFLRTIRDIVEFREKNNIRRNDFLELLIDMKNSEEKLTMNELVGQVFAFFLAGFAAPSRVASMALFEISQNENIQNKIRKEIREVLEKYEGRITYDGLAEMKYLGQVVEETMRLWPPIPNVHRICTKDHKFQNSDVTVEEGTPVLIPTSSLHHDPEYWTDPEKWDPDRFSEENRKNIRPCAYLPFGDGPRNCLGARFGLSQTKIALVTVLKSFRVSLSPNTVTPVEINPQYFLLQTQNVIYLRLKKILNMSAKDQ